MKNIFKTISILVLILLVMSTISCEQEIQFPVEDDEEAILPPIDQEDEELKDPLNPNQRDYLYAPVTVVGRPDDMGGSGVDLLTGQVYQGFNIHNHQHHIDLLYFNYSNVTQGNMILPVSKELSVNSLGEDVQYGWRQKNEGELYQLNNVQARDLTWFNEAKSSARISELVDSMVTVLSANPNSKKDRFRNITNNQIYVFRSVAKNISSLILVTQQLNNTDGSSQSRWIIKSDTTNSQSVAPPSGGLLNANGNFYPDVIEIDFDSNGANDEFYFDLMQKTALRIDQIQKSEMKNKNFLIGRRSSNKQTYLFTATSSPGKTNYGSSQLTSVLNDLSSNGFLPITWKMRRIDNHASYLTSGGFENCRLNNIDIYKFYKSINNAGWASHYTVDADARSLVGRIYSISNRPDQPNPGPDFDKLDDRTDIFFAIFRVKSYNATTGKLVVEVKGWNTMD